MPGASRRLDFAIYWHDLALKHFFKLVEERHFGGAVSLKKRLFQDERLFEVYLEVLESAATESLDSQR